MRSRLFRYVVVVLCLFLSGYYLLRGPSPLWTVTSGNRNILNFAGDSRSFWTYSVLDKNSDQSRILLEQFDVATGAVVKQQSVSLNCAFQASYLELCDEGTVALIDPKGTSSKSIWLVNLANGKVEAPDQGESLANMFRLSPRGTWLIRDEPAEPLAALSIVDHRLAIKLRLPEEIDQQGRKWLARNALFTPDESQLAVVWNHRAATQRESQGELRFYETATWRELSRMKMPQAGFWHLNSWLNNTLWFSAEFESSTLGTDRNRVGESNPTFRISTQPLPGDLAAATKVIQGYDWQEAGPRRLRESVYLSSIGKDWLAVNFFVNRDRPAWLDFCNNIPVVSHILHRLWPEDIHRLQLLESESLKKWNEINVIGLHGFQVSPDARLLSGILLDQDLISLYSTSALARWPGYVFLVAAIIVFVVPRPRLRTGGSQPPVQPT